MLRHLSISLLLLAISLVAKGQTYYPITATSGTQNFTNNSVSITTPNGLCGGTPLGISNHCGITGYNMGCASAINFLFSFTNPISDIRIKISGIEQGQNFYINLNNNPYPISLPDISSCPGNCSMPLASTINNGMLTSTVTQGNNGAGAQIDINPGFQIYDIEIGNPFPQSSATFIATLEVVNDTCGGYTVTATSNNPCEHDVLNLTASTTAPGITGYTWAGPNNFSSTQQNPSIPNAGLSEGGVYVVTAHKGACNYSKYVTATVKQLPTVSNTSSSPSPICPGQTLNLSTANVMNATNYHWTGPNSYSTNTSVNSATIPSTTILNQGWYYVTATVNGCTSYPDSTNVVMTSSVPPPTVTNKTITVCPGTGNSINLGATSTATSPSFVWVGPASFNSTQQYPVITNATFANGGKYYVSAVVNGCQSLPDSTIVTVAISTPTPDADSSIVVCPATTLVMSVPPVAGATDYTWTGPSYFNSTPTPLMSISNMTYAQGGKYYVTATVNNCTSYPDSTIVVVDITTPTPNADSALVVCPGTTMYLHTDTVAGNPNYKWTGPAFPIPAPAQNPVVPNTIYAYAGTYYVTAEVNGCVSHADSTIVVVDITTPTPNADSLIIVCPNTTLTLNVDSIAGATYDWTGPSFNANTRKPSILNVPNKAAGTYYVKATLNGCISRPDSTIVKVEITTPTPDAGSNSPVCENSPINLTAGDIANADFSWTGPQSYSSNAQNPVINNAGSRHAGQYIVRANVDGCISLPDTIQVDIKPAPTVSADGNNVLCETETLILNAGSNIATSFNWTWPDGHTTQDKTLTIADVTAAAGGHYSVTSMENGCLSPQPAIIDVRVKPLPVIPIASSNSAKDSAKKPGQMVKLFSTSGTPGVSYNWVGPDGFTSNDQNPIITFASKNSEGMYTVTTTLEGCSTSAETYVNITTRKYYSLYPNPNKGEFIFMGSLLDDETVPVEVMNAVGQVVYKDTAEVKGKLMLKKISLGNNLSNGVYFLHVPTKTEDWNIRFVISR